MVEGSSALHGGGRLLLTLLAAAVAIGGPGSAAAGSAVPHPRLRLDGTDVRRIRALLNSDAHARELHANLTRHADAVLAAPPPNASTAPDLLCETILDHAYTLGLLYRYPSPLPTPNPLARETQ